MINHSNVIFFLLNWQIISIRLDPAILSLSEDWRENICILCKIKYIDTVKYLISYSPMNIWCDATFIWQRSWERDAKPFICVCRKTSGEHRFDFFSLCCNATQFGSILNAALQMKFNLMEYVNLIKIDYILSSSRSEFIDSWRAREEMHPLWIMYKCEINRK